jgi:hypothetical protein
MINLRRLAAQPNPANQVGEAWVRSNRVQDRHHLYRTKEWQLLCVGLLKA